MIYKTNESVIVIRAEAIKPIDTEVAFWSHDRGTAKLRFKLQKDGVSQSLPEGTNVPIRLMFRSATAEGGYGKHDYLATIEDRVNGIVSIVLEDNILGYVGTVEGSIYIDFSNDQSLDTAGRFSFVIKRSPIDETTPELENYYFNGFEQINAQYVELIKKVDEAQKSIKETASVTEASVNKAKADATNTINQLVDEAKSTVNKVASSATSSVEESAESAKTTIQTAASEVTQTIKENNVYTKGEIDTNFANLSKPQTIDAFWNFTETPTVNSVEVATVQSTAFAKAQKRIDEKANDDWDRRYVVYHRQGDVVVARVLCKPSASGDGEWKVISQFPVGYQPTSRADIISVLRQNSVRNVGGTIYANGNGFVAILDDGTKKYEYLATVTYVTADEFPESDRVTQFTDI